MCRTLPCSWRSRPRSGTGGGLERGVAGPTSTRRISGSNSPEKSRCPWPHRRWQHSSAPDPRGHIAQIDLRLMWILPKQAGQVIHAARVRPLRSDCLHCVRNPIRPTHPTTPPRSGPIPRFSRNSATSPKHPPSGSPKPRVFNRLKIHKSARREPLPPVKGSTGILQDGFAKPSNRP